MTLRILPLLMIGYVVSYIDRINIGFAKLGMEHSFGMSGAAYGFAAGIFFLGYVLAEVPSNIAMARFGARLWLTRIMVTWGVIAGSLAFAGSVEVVYGLRFLLGIAEAGFFPGILLYLTRWYPNAHRPKAVATVMVAIPLASVVGGPLNGWILSTFDGALGLDGWRWIFLLGGVPAVLVGIVFFVAVANRPADARWLTPEQREWLTRTLEAEERDRAAAATPASYRAVFRDRKVMGLCAAYFLLLGGAYPLAYWMPSVIKDVGKGLSSVQIGWLSALPFLLAAICMYVTGRLVRNERSSAPVQIALGVSVVAFTVTAVSLGTPLLALAAICVATMAAQTAKPLFWSLPTAFLAGAGATGGLALINSLGNLAGFVSPFAVGWIQDASGGDDGLSMAVMITANVLAMVVIAGLRAGARRHRPRPEPEPGVPGTAHP
ncbi:MFS transporter [Actinomadura violacea]|uniref:MFS transporter n=1 Tax=Actinomadura violacea TaxID=2819934 RepID=A0ABS3S4Z9_9ACTN|nr:MFS transporter [Actinomadura violacea]MBO2463956.1 MFS transporter [Actinomadura violacea]